MSPPSLDLRPFLGRVLAILRRHALGAPGAYRRFAADRDDDREEAAKPNPYGCADAANLLYTLGRLPGDPDERRAWVAALQCFQDPESGLFREPTHHPIHTTAHCIAALELFDARPLHPLRALAPLRAPDAMVALLESLDWRRSPWLEAHRGAGLYAALVLAEESTPDWVDRFAAWLAENADPATGLLRRGCIPPRAHWKDWTEGANPFPHLAGTFHYLFDLDDARRGIPHPEALVDTCLEVLEREVFPLGASVGFAEIDWVYCLHRGRRQSGHRVAEVERALRGFAERYLAFLEDLDPQRDTGLNDLHRLFGAVCALAELQQAVPGLLRSDRPLRLVLDRRPFI